MPQWTNTPPASDSGPALRIVRTPTTAPLSGAITSPDLVGCPTHYYQHRTIPCEPPNCPACAEGIGWRWHGWVATVLPQSQEHVLFEFTATASEYFRRFRDTYGTLRGCIFVASRINNRPNARVTIRTKQHDPSKIQLPEAPDICKALAHIWGIPPMQATTDGIQKASPVIRIDRSTPITHPND